MQAGAVTGANVYELYYAMYELMGYKVPARFTTKPQMDPQMQMQHQQMQEQIQQLTEMVKFLSTEHDLKAEELKIKWADLALEEKKIEIQYQTDTEDIISKENIAALNVMSRGNSSGTKKAD
jgi:hypothetical protein